MFNDSIAWHHLELIGSTAVDAEVIIDRVNGHVGFNFGLDSDLESDLTGKVITATPASGSVAATVDTAELGLLKMEVGFTDWN